MAARFYILINSAQGLQCFHIFTNQRFPILPKPGSADFFSILRAAAIFSPETFLLFLLEKVSSVAYNHRVLINTQPLPPDSRILSSHPKHLLLCFVGKSIIEMHSHLEKHGALLKRLVFIQGL